MSLLESLPGLLPPAPRVVDVDLRRRLSRPSPPTWVWLRRDPLRLLWREHEALLRNGEVTLGFVYMANNTLFAPGDNDAPCSMLHSFDPFVLRNPELLESIGAVLYRRYTDPDTRLPVGPWFTDVHHATSNDMMRTFGLLLPPTLTWGHVVYLSTPMIHRAHLPIRQLEAQLVPILAARDPRVTGTTMILPAELWPDALRPSPHG